MKNTIALLAALAALLTACHKPPCEVDVQPTAEGEATVSSVWCAGDTVWVVIDKSAPCPESMVQAALDMYAGLGVDTVLLRGDLPSDKRGVITVGVGVIEPYTETVDGVEVTHDPIGMAWNTVFKGSRALKSSRVIVEHCSQDIMNHEIGHALGLGHSKEDHDAMSPIVYPDISKPVAQSTVDAYLSSQ